MKYFISIILSLFSLNLSAKETRDKVAVIDSGLLLGHDIKPYLCERWGYDETGRGVQDELGHGTNIANIIKQGMNKDKQCLVIIRYYHNEFSGKENLTRFIRALALAQILNVKYVNLSSYGDSPNKIEQQVIEELLKTTKVIVAAGNDNKNLSKDCSSYPSCYDFKSTNFYVVSNCVDKKNKVLHTTSNYGGPVTDCEEGVNVSAGNMTMTGTSQAAALRTKRLLDEDNARK